MTLSTGSDISRANQALESFGISALDTPSNVKLVLDLLEAAEGLAGDIIECGVYQGHSVAKIGLFLEMLRSRKHVYGLDSFSGFPPPHPKDGTSQFQTMLAKGLIEDQQMQAVVKRRGQESTEYPPFVSKGYFGDTSYERVSELLERLGLGQRVTLVPGLFRDTLPQLDGVQFSLAFLDCDLYTSYSDCLSFLYPRMVPGGMMIFDEYYSLKYPGARLAVDEFLADKPERIITVYLPEKYGPFPRNYIVRS